MIPLLLAGLLLLNVVAYMQARAMTHFASVGQRTLPPEKLTRLQKLKVLFTGVQIPRPANEKDPSSLAMMFETLHYPISNQITSEAWYIPVAAPRGIVLIFHGFAGCKSTMLAEARLLHDAGYAIFMVDFRGCGGTSGEATTLGFREADDVTAAVNYVRANWPSNRLILYGQSMGSVAILRAIAVNRIQPSAIAIECPYDRILSTVSNRFHSMGLPAFPMAELLVFWGGMQQRFWAFQLDAVEYAKSVSCPTLLLRGENDPRVTDAEAHKVFSAIGSPKQFATIPGAGHESYAKKNPTAWNTTVTDFLNTK